MRSAHYAYSIPVCTSHQAGRLTKSLRCGKMMTACNVAATKAFLFSPGSSFMEPATAIGLKDVQAVYSGPEGDLWELVMGQQIHIGGLQSSMALAEKAGIRAGMSGVDLCCCNGAGMRFLVRFRDVAKMHGVDATETVVERGRARCQAEGLADRITFTLADVCENGLPVGQRGFCLGRRRLVLRSR